MHVIIWEFSVREEYIQEFISAYGADGGWVKLFRRAEGYLGTKLLRSSENSAIFLTIDRWESAGKFEIFQEQYSSEYKNLDAEFGVYTWSERRLGVLYRT